VNIRVVVGNKKYGFCQGLKILNPNKHFRSGLQRSYSRTLRFIALKLKYFVPFAYFSHSYQKITLIRKFRYDSVEPRNLYQKEYVHACRVPWSPSGALCR
jgi:hypothetical protein